MTDEQINLVKELLVIRNQVQDAQEINIIPDLIDVAISKAKAVPPNSINEDILGKAAIEEWKQSAINLLEREKSLVDRLMDIDYIKVQVSASLLMLMNKFANGVDVIERIEKQSLNSTQK